MTVVDDAPVAPNVPAEELRRVLDAQRAAFVAEGSPSAEVRRNRIDRLLAAVLESADDMATALDLDYGGRPTALSKSFEVMAWLPDAEDIRANLETWMAPEPLPDAPGSVGRLEKRPLGVVGVIGAWNFPVILTFQPALAALAAGNRVMIKFPDLHVRTAKVLADAVARHFTEDEVVVVGGDLQTARDFSALPFDHLIFTGSPAIGREVAIAAARNLTPVTLELGGKNPVVVAGDADLELAAHRIAGTRLLNGGQICLCPDYVFVPRAHGERFVELLRAEMAQPYPDGASAPSAVAIVDDRNHQRVTGLVDDAVARGARRIEAVPASPAAGRFVPPTILTDVPAEARISSEEIFGPVLPVYLYDDVAEVIDHVNAGPAPLGAYWYGEEGDDFARFLRHTASGGVTRNDGIVHAFAPGASFGGVGNSGTGAYHGKVGFDRFSHVRTVVASVAPVGISDGMVGSALLSEAVVGAVDQGIAAALAQVRERLG
ncbi:aldehyde dehydrogenase family protein [Pseudonocardia sp. RS010]|uniref:aldehyde dehydrogenase family protein n=1 Tax=Pseudonocardia sp. RS010 TaxID=3385979 RepID=UPI0039A1B0A5